MKYFKIKYILALFIATTIMMACNDLLDEPLENIQLQEKTDYTQSEDMDLYILGAYAQFNDRQWEILPTIGVRGDDVSAAGDQFPMQETDSFRYDRNFWNYNSTFRNLYTDILYYHGMMEEIAKFKEAGANAAEADQYIAEIKVMRAHDLLQLARNWGAVLIPTTSEPNELFNVPLSTYEEVLQHISNQMDEAIPDLLSIHPNQRQDIPGGVTRYTALAVKAMANLELKNWQAVADATGEIISSGLFTLEPNYYQLFKIPGKLNDENLLEMQYSDFGTAAGTRTRYLWNFFGPSNWTPVLEGAIGGWGFWEPTEKYIKFMLDRGEQERLETTVLFTPDGIAELQSDPAYANLPGFITNESRDGDVFNNHPRYNFLSGKYYLPTTQLTPGRNNYGENKNFVVIRYAEVLLMHAEALVSGANSTVMSAAEAINEVRNRAGLPDLGSVTLDDVLDEKDAEFATEMGIRFFDLVRHGKTSELDHEGRDYNEDTDRFLPYPLAQLEILPQLRDEPDNQ